MNKIQSNGFTIGPFKVVGERAGLQKRTRLFLVNAVL